MGCKNVRLLQYQLAETSSGVRHFLHSLSNDRLMDRHDGHMVTFSVVLEVRPKVNRAIPDMAMKNPPRESISKNNVCGSI